MTSTLGWAVQSGTTLGTIAQNTTNWKHGGAALKFDKTSAAASSAQIYKMLPAPIDVQALRSMGARMRWWFYHADPVGDGITSAVMQVMYRRDLSKRDLFTISSPSAGWNMYDELVSDATSSGSPTAADRRGGMRLDCSVVVGDMTDLPTDCTFGPAVVYVPDSNGDPALNALGVLEYADSVSNARVLIPGGFDSMAYDFAPRYLTNEAETAVEQQFQGSRWDIQAHIRNVRPQPWGLHGIANLHAWREYAVRNQDWGIAHDGLQQVNTTLSAASGAGSSFGDILTMADSQHVDFLVSDLGIANPWLVIGPNSQRQTEIARVVSVPSSTTVQLVSALKYAYASGDAVRSLGYFPACALTGGQNPISSTAGAWSLNLRARAAE